MKWILLLLVVGLVWYYLATGTLGGASKATQNYQRVMLGESQGKNKDK